MARTWAIVGAVALLIILFAVTFISIYQSTGGGGSGTVSGGGTSCPTNQYAYQVTNNQSAFAQVVCSQVAWGQLTSFPAGTGGCASGSAFAYKLNSTNYYCSKVSFANLTNLPPNCGTNQYAFGANSTNFQCSQVGWTQLTGFPSPCSAGYFVTAVGATLTCSQVSWSKIINIPIGDVATVSPTIRASVNATGTSGIFAIHLL